MSKFEMNMASQVSLAIAEAIINQVAFTAIRLSNGDSVRTSC